MNYKQQIHRLLIISTVVSLLAFPNNVWAQSIYVSQSDNGTIAKIDSTGTVSTFATVPFPEGLAFDGSGNLFVVNAFGSISKITSNGTVSPFASLPIANGLYRDLAFDGTGNLYAVNDGESATAGGLGSIVVKVSPNASVSIFATLPPGLHGLAIDGDGNLFTSNSRTSQINKIRSNGSVSLFSTLPSGALGLAFDSGGDLYASETFTNRISKITPSGAVTTFTMSAGLNPVGLTFDKSDNLYAAGSYGANKITRISADGNNLSTFATVSSPYFIEAFGLSPKPLPPRLFGLCIGQNDGQRARGDLAAQSVFEKLSSKSTWASASAGNTTAALTFASNFNDNLGSSVSLRLDAMQVRPGDTVVFFYNGHGGPLPGYGDAGETPIDLGLFGGHNSTDDEILASDLTDDDLYRLFNTDKWREVRKIFLIDSCHSGGFIGSSTKDAGDLEKLTNMALFASAREDGNAQGDPFDGQGIWSKYLLLPALDDADLTTTGLQNSINSRLGSIIDSFAGQTLPLLDLNQPGSTALFDINPFSAISEDFDVSQPLIPAPEPSSTLLILFGFSVCGLQRRRKL